MYIHFLYSYYFYYLRERIYYSNLDPKCIRLTGHPFSIYTREKTVSPTLVVGCVKEEDDSCLLMSFTLSVMT